jgi:hypothetical protein
VDSFEVFSQIAFLSEGLITESADKVLSSLMNSNVIYHIASFSERFITAFISATKPLILPVRSAISLKHFLVAAL